MRLRPLIAAVLLACAAGCPQRSGPPSPPTVEPAPPAPPRPFARVRLGDRLFVEAVLTDVFGPSIAPDLQQLVHANPAAFGGPCSLYEQVYYDGKQPTAALADEATRCIGGMPALNHPLVGTSSTLRAGWLARACLRATQNPDALRFALSQLGPAGPEQPPDAASVAAAWRRFFPGRTAPADAVDALVAITPTASAGERWRQIHLALCLTPDWQIP